MKNSFKAFIAFVLAFIMMQSVYAAPGVYIKPDELRGGSVASGNMTPIVRVTPKPQKVKPTPRPTPTPAPLYSDVTESDWFYPAVKAVTEKKYMNGTNDEGDEILTFEPNGKLTRAMFVTILYRLAGTPEVKKATPTPKPTEKPTEKPETDDKATEAPTATAKPTKASPSFKDVKDGMWYSDAVVWATASEIAEGTSGDKFSPDKNITREQTVVMLYRYAKYKKTDTSKEANLLKYNDYAKISEYAIDAFSWACGMGIIDGVGESKKLEPTSGVTRAQAAKIVAAYTGDLHKATETPKETNAEDKQGSTANPDMTDKSTEAPKTTATPSASGSGKKSSSSGSATSTPKPTAAPAATQKPSSEKDTQSTLRLEYDDSASTSTARVVKIYYQNVEGLNGATIILNISTNKATGAVIKCVQDQGVGITSNPTMLSNGRYAVNISVAADDPITSPDNLFATMTLTVPPDIEEFTVSIDKESNIVDHNFEDVDCDDPSTITIPRKSL